MIDFLLHARDTGEPAGAPDGAPGWAMLTGEDPARVLDPQQFRQALGMFATGVTVVTTVAPDGSPRGFTANSFTSVSLNPPLILVCIDRAAQSYAAFTRGSGFAVNILAHDQSEVSQRFASKNADKFDGVAWTRGANGLPLLDGALAWMECRHWRWVTAGDHVVLIGEVLELGVNPGQPLAFFGSAYSAVAALDAAAAGD